MQGTTLDFYHPILRAGEAVNWAKSLDLDWAALAPGGAIFIAPRRARKWLAPHRRTFQSWLNCADRFCR